MTATLALGRVNPRSFQQDSEADYTVLGKRKSREEDSKIVFAVFIDVR